MHRAIALIGPTASGKTALAVHLARALDGEVVSIDSALVYRGMDIGTAKPSAAERGGVPHHLIDLIEPTAAYSAARFRDDALAACAAILARGRVPILAGGTMLYYKALVEGLDDLPRGDAALRAAIAADAAARGWPALHAELARADPATAARLAATDAQRIGRALEVLRLTGRPLSALLQRRPPPALPFALRTIAVEPSDRAVLHARIARRFATMLAAGLIDEVRDLRARHPGLTAETPSMRCVGYRQVWAFLDGRLTGADLHDRGVFATRQLAKRQLTWLRSLPQLERIDCLGDDAPARALALARRFLEESPR
ncbi:MAG: tRNA (adenosine(37)-N6)-dimethylallyltransferase MiaA [Burkholderiales bacterium]|nr:tRNA (adenosine(37)-N6)-dimethylallyltransferase MiaA [Burkholderiales bacterium]